MPAKLDITPGERKARRAEAQKRWRLNKDRDEYLEMRRTNRLKYKHGMTLEDWLSLWDSQGGCCYLCDEPIPKGGTGVAIDHDHRCCPPLHSCSNCRRGLACARCNKAIGLLNDDPELIQLVASRLKGVMLYGNSNLAA
jgi:hypothetical protein